MAVLVHFASTVPSKGPRCGRGRLIKRRKLLANNMLPEEITIDRKMEKETGRMRYAKVIATVLVCIGLAIKVAPAHAAINSMSLGARYDTQTSSITFRVYSSQATYMMLYLYAAGYGAQESATYALSPAGNDVWAATVPVSAIHAAGITGAVYYGTARGVRIGPIVQVGQKGLRRASSRTSMPTATASIRTSSFWTPTRKRSVRIPLTLQIRTATSSRPVRVPGRSTAASTPRRVLC